MLSLENLRRNTEANIAGLLDAAVHINVAVVDDEHQEVGHGVVAVTSLVPDLGDCGQLATDNNISLKTRLTEFTSISQIAHTHPRLLSVLRVRVEDASVALVDLYELLHEGLNRRLGRSSTVLDDADTPSTDVTLLVVHSELAAAESLG